MAELISSALNVNETVPIIEDEALSKEDLIWNSLFPPMLKEKFPGQYVAI